MASKCRGSKEKEQQVDGLCRFHELEPGMSKGPVSNAEDQPIGRCHYIVMPFMLKNAGATYQRMMTRMFRDKIGRMVEVYIDDMVVKSKQ